MFGCTHCPDRVGLRWCSGIESGVIQNHRHCSPVPPCSASYSSLQSRLHAHRARQSSFPANRKCSNNNNNNNSKNTFLYGAFTKLNTPKVLLLQCPCACQSRFLQDDGDISIQSLELIVYDSPFPGVTDVLKIFREAGRQSLDVPTSQFKSWSLL